MKQRRSEDKKKLKEEGVKRCGRSLLSRPSLSPWTAHQRQGSILCRSIECVCCPVPFEEGYCRVGHLQVHPRSTSSPRVCLLVDSKEAVRPFCHCCCCCGRCCPSCLFVARPAIDGMNSVVIGRERDNPSTAAFLPCHAMPCSLLKNEKKDPLSLLARQLWNKGADMNKQCMLGIPVPFLLSRGDRKSSLFTPSFVSSLAHCSLPTLRPHFLLCSATSAINCRYDNH